MKRGTRVKVNNYKYSSIEKGTLYGTVYRDEGYENIAINIDNATNNKSIYDVFYFSRKDVCELVEETDGKESDMNNKYDKILELWEAKQKEKITECYEKNVKQLFKKGTIKKEKVYDVIKGNVCLDEVFSKETRKKFNNEKMDKENKLEKLRKKVEEIKSLCSICETEKGVMKVLVSYEVIDSMYGKIK